MSDTNHLGLPLILAAQAQKHVTHNEALQMIDAILQLGVISRGLAAPPGSPAEGDRYLIAASATGAWSGHDDELAIRLGGVWRFAVPQEGWRLWVAAESVLLVHDGAGWRDIADLIGVLQDMTMLGVNTTADTTNKFALRSNAALFTALYAAGGGNGDFQQKLNKEAAGDTASQLYQMNFSGRAETGLTGDDDFHVKVSPDGSSWKDAIVLDRTSGLATLYGDPTAALHAATKRYVDAGFRILAASAVAASHTGDTLETALATVTIPANAMGPNGIVQIWSLWTATNSAGAKTPRIRLGGTAGTVYAQPAALTTSPALRIFTEIQNRNNAASQVGAPAAVTGFGANAGALVTSSVNTAANADLVITGQLATSSDTITLEAYRIEIAERT
ncbi:hypothetical protein BH10PSE7_BH10PSE7_03760 [soil metagenome]